MRLSVRGSIVGRMGFLSVGERNLWPPRARSYVIRVAANTSFDVDSVERDRAVLEPLGIDRGAGADEALDRLDRVPLAHVHAGRDAIVGVEPERVEGLFGERAPQHEPVVCVVQADVL